MHLRDLPARLEGEFSYPVEVDTVLERVGRVRVDGYGGREAETVASVLDPLGPTTFDSATMLFETIYGALSDDHVGRKFYDDRGGNPPGIDHGPTDEANVSF